MLLIAGFETTVNLLGNAVNALLDHPDQWAALVADPALAGAAVQESLRFDPPVQRTGRISFDDTELAGQPIAAGSGSTCCSAAPTATRRSSRDPDVFDLTRTDGADHLAFSSGIHHCVGATARRARGARSRCRRWPSGCRGCDARAPCAGCAPRPWSAAR